MSRKHYREIAEVLKYVGGRGSLRFEAVTEIAKALASMFKADNSNFRREVFMSACGLPAET